MELGDQNKVIYHGATVNVENPPPYSGPPPPGLYAQPGPYGPPGAYVAPGPYGTHVVTATMVPTMVPAVIVTQRMGPEPTTLRCRSCQQDIVTRIEVKPTTRTHLFAALLCLLGCWPCVCLPYCMGSCTNTDHYCPNCSAYIGSYME